MIISSLSLICINIETPILVTVRQDADRIDYVQECDCRLWEFL
jgi:hypothetical protein